MGMADIATVLFRDFMQFDAADPHWFDRDRFVLSNGHGSMLLYSLLYLTGLKDMTLEELNRFRQIDSKTAGHPEYKHADGIETTTGPLGQGVANSVGFALAERILNAKFGDDICKHWTCVLGDGCLMEGISEEAISMAGHCPPTGKRRLRRPAPASSRAARKWRRATPPALCSTIWLRRFRNCLEVRPI